MKDSSIHALTMTHPYMLPHTHSPTHHLFLSFACLLFCTLPCWCMRTCPCACACACVCMCACLGACTCLQALREDILFEELNRAPGSSWSAYSARRLQMREVEKKLPQKERTIMEFEEYGKKTTKKNPLSHRLLVDSR